MNIIINKSNIFVRGIVFIHAGAIGLLAVMPFPTTVILAAGTLILASLHRQLRNGAAWMTGEWRLTDQGHLHRCRDDDDLVRYRVSAANIFFCCIILRLEDQRQRSSRLLVMRDAVDPERFRELCARIAQHRIPLSHAGHS